MSSILQSMLHLYAGGRSLLTPSSGAVLSPTAIALMGATGLYGAQKPKDDTAATTRTSLIRRSEASSERWQRISSPPTAGSYSSRCSI